MAAAGENAQQLAGARPPGKPLVFKEHWTAALSDQLKLFAVQLACTGGSSAIAKTVVAPLERIKILRQVQHMGALEGSARYAGIGDALRRLPGREGGVKALWRGNGANVVRLFPDVAFRFAVHDQFRIMFAPMDGSPPGVAEKLAAGAATGILKTALFYPLDLCRTRITADQSRTAMPPPAAAAAPAAATPLTAPAAAGAAAASASPAAAASLPSSASPSAAAAAAQVTATASAPLPSTSPTSTSPSPSSAPSTSSAAGGHGGSGGGSGSSGGGGRTYPTIRSCLVATVRGEGVRGLYRGALLSMSGVAPYLAISFTMYDELRRRLPSDRESTSAVWYPFLKMGCGAAAAVSAQTVVYPLDTVRRCMQMNGAAGQAVRYASASDCLRQLLRSHGGVSALYRGCLTNCLKTSLGAPVHFIMYDAIKSAVQALDPTTGVSSPL